MRHRLRSLFLASILLVVFSSYLAINIQTPEMPYVLGAKTEEEGGFFKKYWIKVLKLLNLYQGDQKEPARTFEYVPGRLRTQPEFSQPAAFPTPTASPTPTPMASPYSRPDRLPPLPPLPPTTLGAVVNSSAVNSQNLPALPPATPAKDPVTSTIRSFFEGIYQSFGF